MQIRQLDLFHVAVPLRTKIKHASHERTESDNLVARVTLADGTQGYGEGVPRSYVTNETIDTAFQALGAADLPKLVESPADFRSAVERIGILSLPEIESDPRGMFGNSARCALELALLDAFGRSFGASVGEAVSILAPGRAVSPRRVRYSGAITSQGERAERISAWKMRLYGFAHVKIKVGVSDQNDPERLRRFRNVLGGRVDMRLDANEAWRADDLIARVEPLLPARPSVLEQPIAHDERARLAELRPRLGVPVMLDESLCGFPDALEAARSALADVFNVRLSKCGGIAPTLRIVELALGSGLGLQLGCHPGETGLLSAAGRHLASRLPVFRYVEGSYDRHVLAQNLITSDITFGYGGWAKPLEGPGLGVTVDISKLHHMTIKTATTVYD